MNTAIVAPSINPNPQALAQLRLIAPDAEIVVVGDKKAPPELRAFCQSIRAHYLGVEEQEQLPYRCKEFIPWNCIMRRNLGTLEAIRHGADVIISVDDDNTPVNADWCESFQDVLSGEYSYQLMHSDTGWFNLGDYANDPFAYRGFPYSLRETDYICREDGFTRKIGIANGLIYGDPDINATERIEKHPEVISYDREVLHGMAIDPRNTWTPVNTQNTAYHKDCLPLAFVLPNVGRYDDIWASFIALRVMEAGGHSVYFGEPAVKQERNQHNIFRDLRDELHGMEYTEVFCETLKGAGVDYAAGVLDNLAHVADHLRREWKQPFPHDFLSTWIEDVGKIL